MNKLNKKYKYHVYICRFCETTGISREPTKRERQEDEWIHKIIAPCSCELSGDSVVGMPVTYKRANQLLGKINREYPQL